MQDAKRKNYLLHRICEVYLNKLSFLVDSDSSSYQLKLYFVWTGLIVEYIYAFIY